MVTILFVAAKGYELGITLTSFLSRSMHTSTENWISFLGVSTCLFTRSSNSFWTILSGHARTLSNVTRIQFG